MAQALMLPLEPPHFLLPGCSGSRALQVDVNGQPGNPVAGPKDMEPIEDSTIGGKVSLQPQVSIFGLIKDNCRSRLYLPPIAWTGQHLALLGFEFKKREMRWGKERQRKGRRSASSVRARVGSPTEHPPATKIAKAAQRRSRGPVVTRAAMNAVTGLWYSSELYWRVEHLGDLLEDCGLQHVEPRYVLMRSMLGCPVLTSTSQ